MFLILIAANIEKIVFLFVLTFTFFQVVLPCLCQTKFIKLTFTIFSFSHHRFWAFMDRTERHTNYPNLFRSTSLIHYLLVIFHWNGCLYHIIYKNNGFGSKNWVFSDSETADVVKQYLQSYYWCTLALTTIGDLPRWIKKPAQTASLITNSLPLFLHLPLVTLYASGTKAPALIICPSPPCLFANYAASLNKRIIKCLH